MITREQIRDAIVRGYCTELNERKRIDPELVEAMVVEVMSQIESSLIKQLGSKD